MAIKTRRFSLLSDVVFNLIITKFYSLNRNLLPYLYGYMNKHMIIRRCERARRAGRHTARLTGDWRPAWTPVICGNLQKRRPLAVTCQLSPSWSAVQGVAGSGVQDLCVVKRSMSYEIMAFVK